MKAEIIKVMIVWAQSKESLGENGIIQILDSYTGPRVYEKDKLDSRLTMGAYSVLPFFDKWVDAKRFMCENPGRQIQIPATLGKQLGLL